MTSDGSEHRTGCHVRCDLTGRRALHQQLQKEAQVFLAAVAPSEASEQQASAEVAEACSSSEKEDSETESEEEQPLDPEKMAEEHKAKGGQLFKVLPPCALCLCTLRYFFIRCHFVRSVCLLSRNIGWHLLQSGTQPPHNICFCFYNKMTQHDVPVGRLVRGST